MLPDNWQQVKESILTEFRIATVFMKGHRWNTDFIYASAVYNRLSQVNSFDDLFEFFYEEFKWFTDSRITINPVESMTNGQKYKHIVWVLENFCLGKGKDAEIFQIINSDRINVTDDEIYDSAMIMFELNKPSPEEKKKQIKKLASILYEFET